MNIWFQDGSTAASQLQGRGLKKSRVIIHSLFSIQILKKKVISSSSDLHSTAFCFSSSTNLCFFSYSILWDFLLPLYMWFHSSSFTLCILLLLFKRESFLYYIVWSIFLLSFTLRLSYFFFFSILFRKIFFLSAIFFSTYLCFFIIIIIIFSSSHRNLSKCLFLSIIFSFTYFCFFIFT